MAADVHGMLKRRGVFIYLAKAASGQAVSAGDGLSQWPALDGYNFLLVPRRSGLDPVMRILI
jgi:hypothetical protein